MAIETTGIIDQISNLSFQPQNLWEFYLDSDPDVRFRVQSTSLPFIRFESDTRTTGTKHYTKYVPEEEFDVTFFETTDFATYDYMKAWMDEIFDPTERVFKAGFEEKVGLLCFSRFETEITQEAVQASKPGQLVDVIKEVTYDAPAPDGSGVVVKKTATVNLKQMTDPVPETFQVQGTKVEEKYNKVFRFDGLRILGLQVLSLSYDTGEPILYTASFVADSVTPAPVEDAPAQPSLEYSG